MSAISDEQVASLCRAALQGPGSCAERTAFVKAVKQFKALAVATDIDGACSPCGMPIYMVHSSFLSSEDLATKVTQKTLGELLPMSFGPGDLERQT
ncbi:cytidine deaminase [Puccinia sorghi]|uniref:Cytidine deaminase n=1 Tax=Puccinia sorghi TaxID=27349 RepID=A0A0L6UKJ7_9BASI|nr:cytidine deaminase [Puccinia sorghi]